MLLKDKVAIITGSGSGMGEAEALAFARNGAKVVVADLNHKAAEKVAQVIQDEGFEAIAIEIDVTSTEAIQNLIKKSKETYGSIDILVNNAAVFDKYQTILDTDKEAWQFFVDTNLTSVYELSQAVLPTMIEQGAGIIINIGSIASLVAGKGGVAYTATKHAVVGLTKHIAYEYADKGIQCNTIAPGTIETPLIADVKNSISTDNIPANRFGQVEEVANLALFLASGQSKFINGNTIPIDGGYTIQ